MAAESKCFICNDTVTSRKERVDIYGNSKEAISYKVAAENFLRHRYPGLSLQDVTAKAGQTIAYICKVCGRRFTAWISHITALNNIETAIAQQPFLEGGQQGYPRVSMVSDLNPASDPVCGQKRNAPSDNTSKEKRSKDNTAEV
jgi:hypothetical protein